MHRFLRNADCRSGRRAAVRLTFLVLWTVLPGCSTTTVKGAIDPSCGPQDISQVVMETAQGRIVFELLPSAAPRAVDQIIRLVNGPFIRHEITGDQERTDFAGYYDGLVFDLAFPHNSLATSVRPPPDLILIPTMIDASAVGLDERRILTANEANKLWQFELFPFQAGFASDDEMHPRMREWLNRWGETQSSDFLIGVSQQEINEALGYKYVRGLESRKNTRGAVALEPFDATRDRPRGW